MGTTDRLIRRIRAPLGRLRRTLRGVLEGRLHPYRRRRALRRLENLRGSVSRMLFICLGNKCRSPYAEARVRARLKTDPYVEVASAGLLPGGRTPPEEAVAVAAERSLDLSGHRSRAVTPAMLEAADLVVVMEPGQVAKLPRGGTGEGPPTLVLGDLDPRPVRRRGIRDPWGRDPTTFRAVFDRIDRCSDVLLDTLRPAEQVSSGPGPGPTPSARDAPSTAGR